MADVTQNDAKLMETAREVLGELSDKTAALFGETSNSDLMDLKQSAGKDTSSTELAAIMHMLIFLSDDAIAAKMKDAVDRYTSA